MHNLANYYGIIFTPNFFNTARNLITLLSRFDNLDEKVLLSFDLSFAVMENGRLGAILGR